MTMRKRLTKKERFFNNINLTSDDEVYVGIDVHKIKCHIAIWLNNGIASHPSIEAGGHWVWLMPSIAGNLELLPAM
jgi:hypothetical protein